MPPPVPNGDAGTISINLIPQPDGHYLCEATPTLAGKTGPPKSFCGQNSKHAIAMALEDLARQYRREAEAEQNIDWEAVERSPSGDVIERPFHVTVHFEWIGEDESKFEAMTGRLMGNTVVENADVTVIQLDPELPIEPWKRWERDS